jgi:hypothetical protein
LFVDSAGNVGLGTSSPQTLLHLSALNSGGGAANVIRITDQDTAVVADQICGRIEFETADTTTPGINCQIDALYAGSGGGSKLQFRTGFAGALVNALHISDTGAVGIGTTSPGELLDVSGKAAFSRIKIGSNTATTTTDIELTANAVIRASDSIRNVVNTGGFFGWNIGGTDSSAGTSGSSEVARIDSSGRLLVGTSSTFDVNATFQCLGAIAAQFFRFGADNANLIIGSARGTQSSPLALNNGDIIGTVAFRGHDGSAYTTGATITANVDGGVGTSDFPSRLVFSTTADGASSPTERMRISSAGAIVTACIGDIFNASTSLAAGTSRFFFRGRHSGTVGSVGTGTTVVLVYTNGNIVNTNNSYGAISDIKLKENIVDARSQWDDLKALQVRNYNFREGQTHTQIGLIAQEAELVSPGLVSESPDRDEDGNDLGTVTKCVNYSVLYMKAVKALQEAIERIEILEQRLTDAGIA